VSSLSFFSKLLERLVHNSELAACFLGQQRFDATLTISTETPATTKVYNDTLLAADNGQVIALCLLDLAGAFDIIDQGC